MAQFRSFWYRGPLSPYEQLCLKSFITKGHGFTLYSYEKFPVPKGVQLEDAASVFPEEEVFFYKHGAASGSVAGFSNWFRYKLLDEFGGWWTDTDVLCLSEDVPETDICFAAQDNMMLNTAILKIPAGHPLSGALLREAYALGKNFKWGQCGPGLMTRVVKELSLGRFTVPTNRLYPIPSTRALDVLVTDLKDEVTLATQGSYFHHLWNEKLRRAPILKNVRPPAGSYLGEKFAEHGIEFENSARYSDYQIQRIVESSKLTMALRERDREIARLGQLVEKQAKEITAAREVTH